MSQQKSGAATTHGEEFPENTVADYLKSHPDFFAVSYTHLTLPTILLV